MRVRYTHRLHGSLSWIRTGPGVARASRRGMKNGYAPRIHRVVDYVRRNLDADLSLETLATIAHFSPYHFHRIFRSVTNETIAAFIRRARLERAIYLMRSAPDRPLSSIAMEVGFGTPSEFSRIFKKQYGRTPSSWDRRSRLDDVEDFTAGLIEEVPRAPAPPRVVRHPACKFAYIRVTSPWTGPSLAEGYERLTRWLTGQGVDWRSRALIGVSFDNDKATPLERLTYDLGFSVDNDFTVAGEVGLHALPDLQAVEVHATSLPETAVAWDYLYRAWLPTSGYEPADLPVLKRFRRAPETFDDAAWDVDCSIALRSRSP